MGTNASAQHDAFMRAMIGPRGTPEALSTIVAPVVGLFGEFSANLKDAVTWVDTHNDIATVWLKQAMRETGTLRQKAGELSAFVDTLQHLWANSNDPESIMEIVHNICDINTGLYIANLTAILGEIEGCKAKIDEITVPSVGGVPVAEGKGAGKFLFDMLKHRAEGLVEAFPVIEASLQDYFNEHPDDVFTDNVMTQVYDILGKTNEILNNTKNLCRVMRVAQGQPQ
jgi:hypothetical protein